MNTEATAVLAEKTNKFAQELIRLLEREGFGPELQPGQLANCVRTITFTRKIQQHRILMGPHLTERDRWIVAVERQLTDDLPGGDAESFHRDVTLYSEEHLYSNLLYFVVGGLLYW